MLISTNGLVIKEVKTGESDRIVHILTEKLGVVSAVCKGSRNLKNRLVSSTSLLTYSEFQLYKKKNLYIVDKAETIKGFHKTKNDIETLSLSMYFCQVADFLSPKEEEADAFLKLTLNSLHFLNEGKKSRELVKFIFEMKYMDLTGYAPDFSCCKVCKKSQDEYFYFDIVNGVIICEDCKKRLNIQKVIPVNKTMVKSFRHVLYQPANKIFAFELDESTSKILSKISKNFLHYHWDKNFTSLEFYESLI